MSTNLTAKTRTVRKGPPPGRIGGRLREAISQMVWQGLTRDEAAKAAGMTDHGLYSALRKPHVRHAYLAECEVLRLSGRAKRLHRLEAIAEQSTNMNAAVAAIKAAEQIGDEQITRGGPPVTPGLVFMFVDANGRATDLPPRGAAAVIEHNPRELARPSDVHTDGDDE